MDVTASAFRLKKAEPSASPRAPLARVIGIRLALGALTLWLVSVVVFAATQALPGNAATAILGRDAHDPDAYAALVHTLHLDQPVHSQYLSWLSGVLRGDLGQSLVNKQSVWSLVSDPIVASSALAVMASILSIPIAIAIGVLSAVWDGRLPDMVSNTVNLVIAAMPEFVIGILLVLAFSTGVFHWLPAVSQLDPTTPVWTQFYALALPALTLSLAIAPYVVRMLRASMIAALQSDYVMMARMKGLRESRIIWRHALPNAIVPTIQVVATSIAWLAGGVVTVEYLFAYPGLGSALISAVSTRDVPTIQALCVLVAAFYVVLNLAADVATILISPRLRTGHR